MRKPRDKAKVEVGVQIVERWILARLRHARFFSLAALNQAIALLIDELNQKPFQKRDGSRASVFAAADRPALRPLPADRYEYATWKKSKVHLDYHVEIERRYYSVPHAWVGKTMSVRLTAQSVEIFHQGRRVAAHVRSPMQGTFTTLAAHRPVRHQAIVDLSHEKLLRRAEAIGPGTTGVLYAQIHARKHPEHALRASLGILRLAQDFSALELEAACNRTLALKSTSYRAIRALIQSGAPTQAELTLSLPEHDNVRGPSYYH
ncbi:MAG: Mu transposase domain-containing protein [Burkholderiales bacterium]